MEILQFFFVLRSLNLMQFTSQLKLLIKLLKIKGVFERGCESEGSFIGLKETFWHYFMV